MPLAPDKAQKEESPLPDLSLSHLLSLLGAFAASHLTFFKSLFWAVLILLGTFFLYRRIAGAIFRFCRRLCARSHSPFPLSLLQAVERPARGALLLGGICLSAFVLHFDSPGIHAGWNSLWIKVLRIGLLVLLSVAAARAITPQVTGLFFKRDDSDAMGKTFCIFFSRILKLLIVLIGAVAVLGELAVDVNGLIAGIGLGGLTLALAAQDWASNLFGGIVILFDKPFGVDDWIQVEGSLEGVVEDMTFRTTRVRTFDNAQIVVPNSLLVSKPITNWSRMQKRKVSFDIQLSYDSPPQAIRELTSRILTLLNTESQVNQETISVTFNEFGESALLVRVHYFSDLTGYVDYMKLKESINFRILELVDELGLSFAYPTRTIRFHDGASSLLAPAPNGDPGIG